MSALIFIVMLLVLVVGHEFGHLLAAKWAKMRVEEFGVGFPPKLWGRKVGETEYSVNALPFGGFVKIFGEEESVNTPDPVAFSNRSKVAQALVMFAGPFANFVLAFVLSVTAFMVGVPAALDQTTVAYAEDVKVLVVEVMEESPAEIAGLVSGDRIVSLTVDGVTTNITSPETLSSVIASAGSDVSLLIERGEEPITLVAFPDRGVIADEPERRALGVASVLVGEVVLPPHRAVVAGLQDTISDTEMVFRGLMTLIGQAFTLSADISTLSGPVGIATLAGDAAGVGVGSILAFAAIISVNLGVINLLPFPALDGGRLALLGVEALTRRKVSNKVSNAINISGFVVLILLMLAVTVNDIVRLSA